MDQQDYDLARSIVRDWEARQPESIAALRARLRLELASGAYPAAVQAADRILQQHADDPEALKARSEAARRAQEFVQQLDPAEGE